jgi:hypothetical protein
VDDAAADRVVAFDTSGRFLWAIGGLEGPLGLAAVDREDRIHRPRREYVVVSEREGTRIRKYSFDGRLLAEAAVPPGPEGRPARAGHLEVDLYHNVVATDSVHHRLLKFTPELDFLAAWGEPGVGRSRFRGPTGIAVWPPFGQTFVAEGKGAHYLWVGLDWVERPSVRVDGSRPFLFLRVAPSERAVVRCELVNRQGEVVRRKARLVRPGSHLLSWHLARRGWERRDGGAIRIVHRDPPEPGPYTLRMTARAAYSSRRHHALEEEIEIVLPAWPAEEGVRDREGRGRSAPR